MGGINDTLSELTEYRLPDMRIRYIEVFRFDCTHAKPYCPWSDHCPNCGLLKISCSMASGYAEYVLPDTKDFADLVRWASVFKRLKGLSLEEALHIVNLQPWGELRTKLAESALKDLSVNLGQSEERMRLGRLPLERSFLMDCSQAYFWF